MIIYLPAPVSRATCRRSTSSFTKLELDGTNFHSSACDDTRGSNRTGYPPSVLSCTAWGFSCLANCSASGELLPRLFTLACTSFKEPAVSFSVTLSVNVCFRERRPRILRGMLPYGVRTFLQRTASGSPAIICHPGIRYHKNR